MSIGTVVNPAQGFVLGTVVVTVTNRTAAARAVGDLVMFDMRQGDASVDNSQEGNARSSLANVILPEETSNALALQCGVFGVCLTAAADDATMQVALQGRVQANVVGTNAGVAGEPLTAVATEDTLDTDGTAGEKALGILLEATAAGTEELAWVLFDGVHGFGNLT